MAHQSKLNVIKWVLVITAIIVACILIRHCPRDKGGQISQQIQKLHERHAQDSLNMAKAQIAYNDTIQKIRREKNNAFARYQSSKDSLGNIIAANRQLMKKYKESNHLDFKNWPVDTSAVLAPSGFVLDCKDCFDRLEKTTDSIEYFVYQADAIRTLFISQSAIDSTRIMELENEKIKLNKSYNDLRIAAEVNARSLQSKRKIKTGIGVMLNDKFLPNAVGPGLMYEDKKDRDFSAKVLFGSGRPIYAVDVYIPFHF